jgi:mRNA interferase MazF
MTGSEFGDLVLVPFPFTDQSTTKRRPAVIVSSAAYHRERPDLVILAVTSQVRPVAGLGEASIVQWKEAGLLKPSALKPVLATIERRLVLRTLGKLMEEDRAALRRVLAEMLDA